MYLAPIRIIFSKLGARRQPPLRHQPSLWFRPKPTHRPPSVLWRHPPPLPPAAPTGASRGRSPLTISFLSWVITIKFTPLRTGGFPLIQALHLTFGLHRTAIIGP